MFVSYCARLLGRRIRSLSGESPGTSPKWLSSTTKNASVWCSNNFSQVKLRSETAYWPRGHSLSALRALPGPGRVSVGPSEGPKVGGTGHSQMELLCRVLALDESAPSARKFKKLRKFWKISRWNCTKPREWRAVPRCRLSVRPRRGGVSAKRAPRASKRQARLGNGACAGGARRKGGARQ